MKKVYKDRAEQQEAYRARQKAKQEAAAQDSDERALAIQLGLTFFGEIAPEEDAHWSHEEISCHRKFLRALGQPDVQPGETLRALAKRTWTALLNAKEIGISISGSKWNEGKFEEGSNVWIPLFDPILQDFQGWHGYRVHGGMKADFFENHWRPPKDSGDEPIDIENLGPLPPIKLKKPGLKLTLKIP